MGKVFVGIDPGKTGGIGIVCDGMVSAIRMPDELAGIKKALTHLPNAGDGLIVVIEKSQPMPKQGSVSGFNYGRGYGVLIGMLTMAGIPYHEVRPTEWKKQILAGEPDKKDKAVSIRVCERLFPGVDLIPGKCKNPQDGMAEALLLAEYGRRNSL